MRIESYSRVSRIASRGFHPTLSLAAATWLALTLLALPLEASELYVSDTGLRFEIHSATDISDDLLRVDGDGVFVTHPSIGEVEILNGPDDPRQERSGVSEFFPFDVADVIHVISRIDGFSASLDVQVFVLPAPPVSTQSSYSRGNAIFLAPGYGVVPTATLAYIVAHELGHVMTWGYVDPSPARWSEYCASRGLDPDSDGPSVPHAERNREIIAEDFRYLFGSSLASVAGGIENSSLALPDHVSGLRQMLVSWFASVPVSGTMTVPATAFPNPCNPTTRIEMRLPGDGHDGAGATLLLYDLSGRLVRTLYSTVAGDRAGFQWHGRDEGGRLVASGSYLYVTGCGPVRGRGSVTLVR